MATNKQLLFLSTLFLSFSFHSLILQSDISCRSYHVIVGFLSMLTVWLHVALMIELFVISVFPKKLNSVSSNERAHFLTLLLLTLLLIINMNYFWTIKRQTVSTTITSVSQLSQATPPYPQSVQQSMITIYDPVNIFVFSPGRHIFYLRIKAQLNAKMFVAFTFSNGLNKCKRARFHS